MSLTCGCDDFDIEFIEERQPTARKQHKCGECFRLIQIGEAYTYISTKQDGDFFTHKCCEECRDLAYSMEALGFCWYFGELRNDHKEYIDLYQPPKLRGAA